MTSIEVTALEKGFKTKKSIFKAVDGVSFSIQEGSIFSLLGPNGAGKTTTIKMLSTLLLPDRGSAKIHGFDIVKEDLKIRKILGTVMPGERTLYWKLTVRENLEYFGALHALRKQFVQDRIDKLLDKFDLLDKKNVLVEKLSTGLRQRVVLCRALLSDPKVLLLDEPTLGLDPTAARNLRDLIRTIRNEGKTILLTTHYMYEADELSDTVAIIDGGKIIAMDTPEALKESLNAQRIMQLVSTDLPEPFCDGLKESFSVPTLNHERTNGHITLSFPVKSVENAVSTVTRLASEHNVKLDNISLSEPSLEDVFIEKTGKTFSLAEGGVHA